MVKGMKEKWAYEADMQAALPGLSVVATPIGNLRDITLRALDVLASADGVLCEDKRITRRLLSRYGLRVARLDSYHEKNAEKRHSAIMEELRKGAKLALVSDAGTPLISDPGHKLVCSCIEENIPLWPLPGPSAPVAALSVSGMACDPFTFLGFPPPRSGPRRRFFEDWAACKATLVFFEAPHRIAASLHDMNEYFSTRKIAVMREMTKYYQHYVYTGFPRILDQVARGDIPSKGEFVVVVAPPTQRSQEEDAEEALLWLRENLPHMTVRKAVDEAAHHFSLPKRLIYQHALALKNKGG